MSHRKVLNCKKWCWNWLMRQGLKGWNWVRSTPTVRVNVIHMQRPSDWWWLKGGNLAQWYASPRLVHLSCMVRYNNAGKMSWPSKIWRSLDNLLITHCHQQRSYNSFKLYGIFCILTTIILHFTCCKTKSVRLSLVLNTKSWIHVCYVDIIYTANS